MQVLLIFLLENYLYLTLPGYWLYMGTVMIKLFRKENVNKKRGDYDEK